ncbi:MAG TPA: hypothetical protein PLZ43_13585 [bacterium]|nr:hypothetical protein [bacterium]
MSEFDRYLKLDLTTQELIDWDIPCNAEGVFARFSISYEKFKGDEEFFLTVFSKAAADWVKKKKKGTKLDSLSKHFSTYLKKDMKKREDLKKNTGETRTTAEPETSKPKNIDDIPEGPGFDDLDTIDSEKKEPEKQEERNSVYEDPESDPFPVEESEKVFSVSSPVTHHPSPLTTHDSPQPEVTHDSPPTLSILDEEDFEEPDIVDSEKSETETFEKHKRKRSGLMTGFIIMFVLLIGTGIAMTVLSKMFEVEKPVEEKPIEDYSEMKKGQIQGSLTKAMNEKDNTELIEQKVSQEESKETAQNPSHTAEKNRNTSSSGGSSGGNYGSNAKKDEEILNQYASEVDPASGGSVSAGNPRGGRRYFTPGGGGTQGGVFIKGSENSSSGKKSLDMHNIKVKVRLEFSIRSTAASTVIAVVTEDSDRIPKGAKFYGSATGYVNKRTQLSFSKLLMNGEEYTVKGFGISGKDPGIESEVTDIAKDNIDSSIKQGVVQTLANVANKYAGGAGEVAGDASQNTVDPAAGEIQKQQEANKMTQEYRVPAGTSFFIYLE